MVRQNKILKKPIAFWKGVINAAFLLAFCMIAWPGLAQFNAEYNKIYLSGQITNNINGTPITNQQIFISSDSSQNNGFSYFSTTVSDLNGFYFDTIATPLGDGNLKIYLYDYCNKLVEVTQYYRFILEEEEYLMFADFQIYNPIITVNYQANFVAESDPYGNIPLLVTLRDISTTFLTKSWTWDFGDGTSSLEQNPNHEYSEPGIYRVSLTVSSEPVTHEMYISSTITKQVKVGLREYHHIGGHVFAGYFPIDLGLAYLYMYDENDELIPIDTTEIDTLGYYYFYEVPQGMYITKARLQAGSTLYGQFIPTYIGDVFIWDQAEIVNLESNNWECNISLIQSSGSPPGESKIIGQISYDTASIIPTLVPAGDIEIVLLNDHGTCLTCSLSDIGGFFQFAGIDYGTYQLYPDVVGLRNSTMLVTLSEENPVAGDVSLVINHEEITFSVNEHQSEFIDGATRIYPNPAYNMARLLLDVKKHSSFTVVVTDQSGRTVSRKDINLDRGSREITLDLSILSAGMYQVVVIPQDGVRLTSKLMKLN